jgi:hypothetical protein
VCTRVASCTRGFLCCSAGVYVRLDMCMHAQTAQTERVSVSVVLALHGAFHGLCMGFALALHGLFMGFSFALHGLYTVHWFCLQVRAAELEAVRAAADSDGEDGEGRPAGTSGRGGRSGKAGRSGGKRGGSAPHGDTDGDAKSDSSDHEGQKGRGEEDMTDVGERLALCRCSIAVLHVWYA